MANLRVSDELAMRVRALAEERQVEIEDIIRVSVAGMTSSLLLYAPHDKIGFGKYADETVETIIRLDPRYIAWASANTDRFRLGKAASLLFREMTGAVV